MNDNGQEVDAPANAAHAEVLRAAGQAADEAIDPGAVALALAAIDCPGQTLAPYQEHLLELQRAVLTACVDPGNLEARAQALTSVIGETFGYAGDTGAYEDMRNANLMHVIDRRKGLPVALGIIYIVTARGLGWDCSGLNFPAHFLIRLGHGQARRILDPFNGGKVVEANGLRELLKYFGGNEVELKPEHTQPVSNRNLLMRLLNNIRGRAVAAQDLARASEIMHRMLMIAPNSAELWHDYGLTLARKGTFRKAMEAMENCREQADDPRLRKFADDAIAKLRTFLN